MKQRDGNKLTMEMPYNKFHLNLLKECNTHVQKFSATLKKITHGNTDTTEMLYISL